MKHLPLLQNFRAVLPASLLVLSGCAAPFGQNAASSAIQTTPSASFEEFVDDLFRSEVSSNTINLHFTLSHPEAYGITETPITLGDLSTDAVLSSQAAMENLLSALEGYDYDALSEDQRFTYDILLDYLQLQLSLSNFTYYDEILRPSTGIQAQLPVLYEEYRFHEKKDVEDYLALIALTKDYFSQIVAFERQKADAGLFMSDYACNAIISQCKTFTEHTDDHYLIQTFAHKLEDVPDLTEEERSSYRKQNEQLVKDEILPAYDMLAAALTELLGSGSNEMGLCYFPDGREYYGYLVRQSTGSGREIKEIQSLIEEKRTSDLAEASLLLAESPSLANAAVSLNTGASTAALERLQEEMLAQFPAAPETSFTVSYIDKCMEDYMAPAFYITSPIDDHEQNSIFINASTDSSSIRYFTTLAHEGFPGHLYQTVMSYETGLPPIRSILNYPGYVEGWATYVEMLSYHYAGLDDSLAEYLALNQSALLSLYASTDLGIHYDGWSFADTLAFWNGYGITDREALREVYELIVEEPAHYLKYYVGYLELEELKKRATQTYGADYSDITFHQAVLTMGPAPFPILNAYFDQYYQAASTARSIPNQDARIALHSKLPGKHLALTQEQIIDIPAAAGKRFKVCLPL